MAGSSRPDPAITILKLVGILAVVGLLFAGLLLPYVGGLGLVAKSEGSKFLDQPCALTETPPPLKTTIYARDGKTAIASLFTQDRQPIPLASMPKVLQEALVATEDKRFYQHQGVDMRGLIRSALQTTGGDTQGGSTLTMQYVKQERYYQATGDAAAQAAAVDQNIDRKIEDAKCAIAIEKRESKQQILANYLNIAFFGENSYGIQTAAQTYFGKNTSQLDLAESAMLVGVLRAPSEYDPFNDRKVAQARRNLVIQNLVDQNYISAAEGSRAKAEPINLATTAPPEVQQGCAAPLGGIRNVQFFCDYAVQWLQDSKTITSKQLTEGGLKIVTTLSPGLQNATQDSLWSQMPATSPTTAVMPEVDPQSGDVLAMATSKKYGNPTSPADNTHTVLPVFTDPVTGGASTYKLFTMLAALNAGATASLQLGNNDVASNYTKYNTRFCSGGSYHAQNSEAQNYTINETLASAIAKSSNTYFVALEDEFFNQCDLKPAVQMALNLGMTSLNETEGSSPKTVAQANIDQSRATFTLGQAGTSPLELAGAYSALAHDGVFCPPAPVMSITDSSGKAVQVNRTPCAAKLSPQVARTALQLLVPDTQSGTSAASFGNYYGQGGADDRRQDRHEQCHRRARQRQRQELVAVVRRRHADHRRHHSADQLRSPVEQHHRPAGCGGRDSCLRRLRRADVGKRAWPGSALAAALDLAGAERRPERRTGHVGHRHGPPYRQDRADAAGFQGRGLRKRPTVLRQLAAVLLRRVRATGCGRTRRHGDNLLEQRQCPVRLHPAPAAGRDQADLAPHVRRAGRPKPDPSAAGSLSRAQPPSWRRTSSLTRLPSARPATAGWTIFITAPIWRGSVAPASVIAARTSSASSSSPS